MWFDDLYRPAERHLKLYVPGTADHSLRYWRADFTSDELHGLAKFHEVFDAECDALPIERSDWINDPGWIRVSKAAQLALKRNGWLGTSSPAPES